MPKVSVITPMYNAERFIGATIESVRAQTLQDWEHIIVDDGSTDNSVEVVKRYLPLEPRLRLVQQENKGVSAARNHGYFEASASSDYLVFFDADDVMEPEMLQTLSAYLDIYPDVGMVYCSAGGIDENGQKIASNLSKSRWPPRYVPSRLGVRKLHDEDPETPITSVFGLVPILPSLMMIRRCVYAKTSGFDESLVQFEDADLCVQIALQARIHCIQEPLVRYRIHEGSASSPRYRERYEFYKQKFFAKWRQNIELMPNQAQMLQKAFWFRETRLEPYFGLRAGWRHLKKGQLGLAARFWGGAVKRYVKGLMFPPK
ncbi:MAG TPA: glycosyltransferase [Chthonomonas sp.]|uniref:glycosyltransferase family 2 protein n=1 Tax=Chthonomonas sp. TaxID=2282153 RepID=UPI002B4B670E|nr:glycosyltransferase [Chthonomonas sp.]HLI49127.1 glycosyltransferase [Chthonomonas sp.]